MADTRIRSALDPTSRHWAFAAGGTSLVPMLLQLPGTIAATVAVCAIAVAALAWRQPAHGLIRVLLALSLVGTVLVLTRFSLGRDTGCALLAAMLAIKPSETATLRDARSLVGFALFAPFATFLLDQGPLTLALGLIAAIVALGALQRFADMESGDLRVIPIRQRLPAIGRLLGTGIPLALAAFWLFPRMSAPMWGVPERALARPGLSDTMTPGEWVELMNDDTPTLRVRFFGATPRQEEMYWRGPVLWNFDGRSWTQPRWFRNLPPAEVEPAAPRWDYEMEFEPTDRRQLVALDLPMAAPAGTRLSIDHGLWAERPQSSLGRWRMQSAPPRRYETQLPQTLRRAALELPPGFNPRTLALARQWRAEAGPDDTAVVRRALAWIRAEFVYTLATPLPGRHAVDEFLFDFKQGFCEHFSSGFVVLMRGAGIPARVVTGYAGGYRNPYGGYWLVRRSDAHAWAEVWLPERGWVRVDPTAAVAPERIYDTLADRAPGAGLFGDAGGITPVLNVTDWLRRGWNDFVLGFNATRQQDLLKPLGMDRWGSRGLIALFGLAGGLALLWMLWLSTQGPRERNPVIRAWRHLGRRYARVGLGREPHEPAGDWARRVATTQPGGAPGLLELSHRFNNWRYAGTRAGRSAAREQRDLVRALLAHRPSTPGEHR
ncbi:transglutaminase TgpA family protein [Lysobacter olei]